MQNCNPSLPGQISLDDYTLNEINFILPNQTCTFQSAFLGQELEGGNIIINRHPIECYKPGKSEKKEGSREPQSGDIFEEIINLGNEPKFIEIEERNTLAVEPIFGVERRFAESHAYQVPIIQGNYESISQAIESQNYLGAVAFRSESRYSGNILIRWHLSVRKLVEWTTRIWMDGGGSQDYQTISQDTIMSPEFFQVKPDGKMEKIANWREYIQMSYEGGNTAGIWIHSPTKTDFSRRMLWIGDNNYSPVSEGGYPAPFWVGKKLIQNSIGYGSYVSETDRRYINVLNNKKYSFIVYINGALAEPRFDRSQTTTWGDNPSTPPTNDEDCMSDCCDCITAVAEVMERYLAEIDRRNESLKEDLKKYIANRLYDQSKFLQEQMIALDGREIDFTPVINQMRQTEWNLWAGANLPQKRPSELPPQ